jgi:hypothetical protein
LVFAGKNGLRERIRTSGPYVPNVDLTVRNRRIRAFSGPIAHERVPNRLATPENVLPGYSRAQAAQTV